MTAKIIDGKTAAENIRNILKTQVAELKKQKSITPGLAVVLVGENPASQIYVRNKAKQTVEIGMNSYEYKLQDTITQNELVALIEKLNSDHNVHGILVQLPLPAHIDENVIINCISPEKDVDGFHVINAGRLLTGQKNATIPCTPKGCMILIKQHISDISGLKALVIGRSNIVGKPMAHLLLRENCTVTIAHSRTKNLQKECQQADIIVAAVGVPEIVRGNWIKPGAIIIDVGMNRLDDGRLVGDVCFAEACKIASAITPVPGGVGPMTIACLLQNTLESAAKY